MAENLSLFKVRNLGPTCASLLPLFPACSASWRRVAAKFVLERHWVPRGPERGLVERRVARPKKCQIEMRPTASDACVNGRVCPAALRTTECVPPANRAPGLPCPVSFLLGGEAHTKIVRRKTYENRHAGPRAEIRINLGARAAYDRWFFGFPEKRLRLRESHGRDEQVHRRLLDVGAERIRRRCHVINLSALRSRSSRPSSSSIKGEAHRLLGIPCLAALC